MRGPRPRPARDARGALARGARRARRARRALLGDTYFHASVADLTIPFVRNYRGPFMAIGIIGGWGMLALGLSYYVRERIGVNRWKVLHRFTALAWILGIVHSLGEGTDAGRLWFLATVGIAAGPPLAAAPRPHGARPPPHARRRRAPPSRRPQRADRARGTQAALASTTVRLARPGVSRAEDLGAQQRLVGAVHERAAEPARAAEEPEDEPHLRAVDDHDRLAPAGSRRRSRARRAPATSPSRTAAPPVGPHSSSPRSWSVATSPGQTAHACTPLPGELVVEHLREPDHAPLARAVGGVAGAADQPELRGDEHDRAAAALAHPGQHALGQPQRAADVQPPASARTPPA